MGGYFQYVGFYYEPNVQYFMMRIEAEYQIEAENKFIKYIEEENGRCIHEIFVSLISDLDIIN
jgi:hypothetical protein